MIARDQTLPIGNAYASNCARNLPDCHDGHRLAMSGAAAPIGWPQVPSRPCMMSRAVFILWHPLSGSPKTTRGVSCARLISTFP